MAKLRPTSFDYLVMALNPALVMVLVGSLVYFLIEVSYEGEFQTRLCFIMSCFVLATVGITRIAIELDAARASMYGLVLSGAMLFVAPRFADVPIPLLIVLLAVIWYSAHRLTWDCTLVDEDQDASGEGLLQRMGLDAAPSEAARETLPTSPLWKRLFAPDKSKHAPGLTVVYFSLAALPIFGILQGFIPTSDIEGRSRAFLYLMAYVGAGLGLLLTTSLLGLRRYLRQRQVEMPADMTVTWIAVGAMLIGVVLGLSTILPRSARELQLGKSPITFTSVDQTARRGGWGKEGAKGEQEGQGENKNEQNPHGKPGEKEQRGGKPDPNAKKGDQGNGGNQQRVQQRGDQKQGQGGDQKGHAQEADTDQKDNNSDPSKPHSPEGPQQKPDEPNGNGNKPEDRDEPRQRQEQKNGPGRQQNQQQQNQQKNQQENQQGRAPREQNPPQEGKGQQQKSSAPPSQPMKMNFDPTATVPFLSWLVKVLVVAAIAVALIYCAIRYWREFLAGIRQFWAEFANFWRSLFGGRKGYEIAAEDVAEVRARRFSDFSNPFRRGGTSQETRLLVQQTFAALEAWARDHGYPREKEQTAFEFADALSLRVSDLAKESKWLAECYSRAAYSSEDVSTNVHSSLATVWQRMEQFYGRIPPPAPSA